MAFTIEDLRDLLALLRQRPAWRDAVRREVLTEDSHVVDSRDVERAHDRASILARLGFATIPAVGGGCLTEDAAILAEGTERELLERIPGDVRRRIEKIYVEYWFLTNPLATTHS
jgi:hypothetical protein